VDSHYANVETACYKTYPYNVLIGPGLRVKGLTLKVKG
jgi:hypothetical protein